MNRSRGKILLTCSPKMRIEKRKSVSGFRFFVSGPSPLKPIDGVAATKVSNLYHLPLGDC